MATLITDAIVIHSFNYLESSRILRLVTRDAGSQSVLARGARGSRSRFGRAMGLFAGGSACLSLREGRDLQTLTAFDVQESRELLSSSYLRFLGASVLAEMALRFSTAESSPESFDAIGTALDAICSATEAAVTATTLAQAWMLIGSFGFAPSLEDCASCRRSLAVGHSYGFSHRSGGLLCGECAALSAPDRSLPPDAREALQRWRAGEILADTVAVESGAARSHARLLREFVVEHLAEERRMRAFEMWESAL